MEPRLLTIALAAAATVALMALGLGRMLLAPQLAVRSRLATLHAPAASHGPQHTEVLRTRRLFPRATADRLLRRLTGPAARRRLDLAGISMNAGDFLVVRVALAVGAGTAAAVAGAASGASDASLSLGLLGALAGLVAPWIYLRWRTVRRARQVERQLVELCDVVSTMLASGFGYLQALRAAADQVGNPLGGEVHRFLDEVSLGSEFDHALAELRARLGSADFEVIATALEVQRRTGGNLAEILRGVGLTIRDRQSFHRELRALTARERLSAVIVAVFPLMLAGLLTAVMPDVFGRLFTDHVGRIILVIALGMDVTGYLVARRVATLEV